MVDVYLLRREAQIQASAMPDMWKQESCQQRGRKCRSAPSRFERK